MWQKIVKYLRGSIDELRKVSWPTRQETIKYSIIVIISVIISVGILALLDFGLSKVVNIFLVS